MEDASRVSIGPHPTHPSLILVKMRFVRDNPIYTLSPGLDELLVHLAALPRERFEVDLDALVDEKLAEFRPCNQRALDQIARYRAAPRKLYEAIVRVDEREREAEITLKWRREAERIRETECAREPT
jgi:hypothetical protein